VIRPASAPNILSPRKHCCRWLQDRCLEARCGVPSRGMLRTGKTSVSSAVRSSGPPANPPGTGSAGISAFCTNASLCSLEPQTTEISNPPPVGPAVWDRCPWGRPDSGCRTLTIARYCSSVPPGQKWVRRNDHGHERSHQVGQSSLSNPNRSMRRDGRRSRSAATVLSTIDLRSSVSRAVRTHSTGASTARPRWRSGCSAVGSAHWRSSPQG